MKAVTADFPIESGDDVVAGAARHSAVVEPLRAETSIEVDTVCVTDLQSLETALSAGLLAQWREVLERDSTASPFQSPDWCLPWYRCYGATHAPYVIVVKRSDRVVGVVPMAVELQTGFLRFASDTLADYQDVVAVPVFRHSVVSELVRSYVAGGFSNPLQIGWIDPVSDTPVLIAPICRDQGLKYRIWHQACWRWFPADGENLKQRFSRIRTHLNFFKRQGEVTFELIERANWTSFRDEFFKQHSLRQLQAGRPVSFNDVRKQRFYDALIESNGLKMQVAALRVNGQMMSGHVGVVWRNVLLLGAPSLRIDAEQRSPALILLSWIFQSAHALGLAGVDLTVGDTEFKRRLGNTCVKAVRIEIYGRRQVYYFKAARAGAVMAAKRIVRALGWEHAWKTHVKPWSDWFSEERQRVSEAGVLGRTAAGLGHLAAAVYHQRTWLSYSIDRDQILARSTSPTDNGYEIHRNCVDDLLLETQPSFQVREAISACARSYGAIRASNHSLHTLVARDSLAAWCYSYTAEAATERSPELRPEDACEPRSLVIYGTYVLPRFRNRGVEDVLLTRVAGSITADGAAAVHANAWADERQLTASLDRLGFRLCVTDRHRSAFGRPFRRTWIRHSVV
jgi:CelD/BcsL family acetyltransferase involved in cellulose biosynthesis